MENEKITIKIPPCNTSDPCFGYEDYDPCELSDDLTEKDLAVLLKEEKLKLQEREIAAKQMLLAQQTGKEDGIEIQDAALGKGQEAALGKGQEAALGKGQEAAPGKNQEAAVGKRQEAGQDKSERLEDGQKSGEEEASGKKKTCKKVIKNPFFSNRLNFSTDLPPPPPEPPPQFFPTVEETSSTDKICLKKKRKCRKYDEARKYDEYNRRKTLKDGTKVDGEYSDEYTDGKHGKRDEDGEYDESDEYGEYGEDGEDGKSGKHGEHSGDDTDTDTGGEGRDDDWGQDGKSRKRGRDGEDALAGAKKKRCPKPGSRPPCRKKSEEISITLQPRQIPAAQKELPPTCPRDISQYEHTRVACKKVCKKKKT